MSRLNLNAAKILQKYKVGCSTDVTGSGIKGHLENLAIAQKKELKFRVNKLPIIRKMDLINKNVLNFKLDLGYSAETSGGLLIAFDPQSAYKFVEEMHQIGEWAWIVGDVIEGNREVEISQNPEMIYI